MSCVPVRASLACTDERSGVVVRMRGKWGGDDAVVAQRHMVHR